MSFSVLTKGHYDYVDVTRKVQDGIKEYGARDGVAVVFVDGSTAAITTMEYEEGVAKDITEVLEHIAPERGEYEHHQKWGDKNGAAHIKAALIGPSVVVPVRAGRLGLGRWQQIVLIDFDEKPREREIHVTLLEAS